MRRYRLVLVPLLIFALAPANAQDDTRARLQALERERATSAQKAERYARQARQLEDRVEKSMAQAKALTAQIETSRAAIAQARLRETAAQSELVVLQDDLARQQAPLVRMMAALQRFARRPPLLALLQPATIQDQMRRRALFSAMAPQIASRTDALQRDLARAERLRVTAADARLAGLRARTDLADRREALLALASEEDDLARSLASAADLARRRAVVSGAEAKTISALLGDTQSARGLSRQLATLPVPAAGTSRSRSGFSPELPTNGQVVMGYGEKDASGLRSNGITIATGPSQDVRAPLTGSVLFAGEWPGYEQVVVIRDDTGQSALLAGLGSLSVRQGSAVRAGQVVGKTPQADPRLLYERRSGGEVVHPFAR